MPKAKLKFTPGLFWDVNLSALNPARHSQFIIARTFKFGEIADWQQLKKMYTWPQLKFAYRKTRDLDPRSKVFWGVVFK